MPEVIRIDDPDDPAIAGFVSIRERDLIRDHDSFIAEGTVVLTMLASARARANGFRPASLLILENRLAGLADLLDRLDPDVPVHVASQKVIDAIAGFHLHRGVLALGRKPPAITRPQLLAGLPETALVLAACGISNHDNIGSMFRNAAAFGVDAVLLDETCCDPLYRKALRVSVGSVLAVPFCRSGQVVALCQDLQASGFDLWGLSPRGKVDLRDLPAGGRVALLAGTEGQGLPESILDAIQTVRIAQSADLDSLNVATATGIALHAAAHAMGKI